MINHLNSETGKNPSITPAHTSSRRLARASMVLAVAALAVAFFAPLILALTGNLSGVVFQWFGRAELIIVITASIPALALTGFIFGLMALVKTWRCRNDVNDERLPVRGLLLNFLILAAIVMILLSAIIHKLNLGT